MFPQFERLYQSLHSKRFALVTNIQQKPENALLKSHKRDVA
jgi:hypothetical protein